MAEKAEKQFNAEREREVETTKVRVARSPVIQTERINTRAMTKFNAEEELAKKEAKIKLLKVLNAKILKRLEELEKKGDTVHEASEEKTRSSNGHNNLAEVLGAISHRLDKLEKRESTNIRGGAKNINKENNNREKANEIIENFENAQRRETNTNNNATINCANKLCRKFDIIETRKNAEGNANAIKLRQASREKIRIKEDPVDIMSKKGDNLKTKGITIEEAKQTSIKKFPGEDPEVDEIELVKPEMKKIKSEKIRREESLERFEAMIERLEQKIAKRKLEEYTHQTICDNNFNDQAEIGEKPSQKKKRKDTAYEDDATSICVTEMRAETVEKIPGVIKEATAAAKLVIRYGSNNGAHVPKIKGVKKEEKMNETTSEENDKISMKRDEQNLILKTNQNIKKKNQEEKLLKKKKEDQLKYKTSRENVAEQRINQRDNKYLEMKQKNNYPSDEEKLIASINRWKNLGIYKEEEDFPRNKNNGENLKQQQDDPATENNKMKKNLKTTKYAIRGITINKKPPSAIISQVDPKEDNGKLVILQIEEDTSKNKIKLKNKLNQQDLKFPNKSNRKNIEIKIENNQTNKKNVKEDVQQNSINETLITNEMDNKENVQENIIHKTNVKNKIIIENEKNGIEDIQEDVFEKSINEDIINNENKLRKIDTIYINNEIEKVYLHYKDIKENLIKYKDLNGTKEKMRTTREEYTKQEKRIITEKQLQTTFEKYIEEKFERDTREENLQVIQYQLESNQTEENAGNKIHRKNETNKNLIQNIQLINKQQYKIYKKVRRKFYTTKVRITKLKTLKSNIHKIKVKLKRMIILNEIKCKIRKIIKNNLLKFIKKINKLNQQIKEENYNLNYNLNTGNYYLYKKPNMEQVKNNINEDHQEINIKNKNNKENLITTEIYKFMNKIQQKRKHNIVKKFYKMDESRKQRSSPNTQQRHCPNILQKGLCRYKSRQTPLAGVMRPAIRVDVTENTEMEGKQKEERKLVRCPSVMLTSMIEAEEAAEDYIESMEWNEPQDPLSQTFDESKENTATTVTVAAQIEGKSTEPDRRLSQQATASSGQAAQQDAKPRVHPERKDEMGKDHQKPKKSEERED